MTVNGAHLSSICLAIKIGPLLCKSYLMIQIVDLLNIVFSRFFSDDETGHHPLYCSFGDSVFPKALQVNNIHALFDKLSFLQLSIPKTCTNDLYNGKLTPLLAIDREETLNAEISWM